MMQPARREASTAMTTRTYEVQRFVQGRWSVESVADNKDVAIEFAKSLMRGKRAPSGGVRVMSVETKADGAFSEVSVFRTGGEQKPIETAPKPKIEIKPAPPKTEMRDFKHVDPPVKVAKKRSGFGNVLYALGLACGLGATLVVVQLLVHLMR